MYRLESSCSDIDLVVAEIQRGNRFLVSTHLNPEGDAVGSALALSQGLMNLGKEVDIYLEDPVPELLEFLPLVNRVTHKLDVNIRYDALIVVDCGGADRFGKGYKSLHEYGALVNIDHHKTNSRYGDINLIDEAASSTGEVVYDVLKALDSKITTDIATNIYVAILTDTGSFRYSSSTPKAFRVASKMVEKGADPWDIAQRIYESYPEKRFKLLGDVLLTLKVSDGGKIASVYITNDMLERNEATRDATDGFVNYPRSIRGVEVAFMLREAGFNAFKISFRSRGAVDVSSVAQEFGGGGHRNAAGGNIEGSLEECREKVTALIRKRLGE